MSNERDPNGRESGNTNNSCSDGNGGNGRERFRQHMPEYEQHRKVNLGLRKDRKVDTSLC